MPKIHGAEAKTLAKDVVSQAQLLIKFERSSLHGERARRRPRLGRRVDDAHADAELFEQQGQPQTRRARADHQHLCGAHSPSKLKDCTGDAKVCAATRLRNTRQSSRHPSGAPMARRRLGIGQYWPLV